MLNYWSFATDLLLDIKGMMLMPHLKKEPELSYLHFYFQIASNRWPWVQSWEKESVSSSKYLVVFSPYIEFKLIMIKSKSNLLGTHFIKIGNLGWNFNFSAILF